MNKSGKTLCGQIALFVLGVLVFLPLIRVSSPAIAEEGISELPWNLQANAMVTQSGTGGRRSSALQLRITAWTTEEDRQQILTEIQEATAQGGRRGNRAVARALRGASRVGTLNAPGQMGWSLRYARATPMPDGKQRVLLATDRPVAFAEAWTSTRGGDFDVTVIQLTLDAEGNGEGTLSFGTEVIWNTETESLEVTNITSQPIALGNVRRTN
jgi:hypothetical protein